jgi:hypothetical protein
MQPPSETDGKFLAAHFGSARKMELFIQASKPKRGRSQPLIHLINAHSAARPFRPP